MYSYFILQSGTKYGSKELWFDIEEAGEYTYLETAREQVKYFNYLGSIRIIKRTIIDEVIE